MSFVLVSVSDCTSVAIIVPPAVTVIGPFAVSTSVSVMPSHSATSMLPAPVTLKSALLTVVLRLMPLTAVAVSTSPVTRPVGFVVEIVPLPVSALRVTSPSAVRR